MRFLSINAQSYSQLTIDDQLVFLVSYVSVGRELGLHREVASYTALVDDVGARYRAGVRSLKQQLDKLCIDVGAI